MPIPRATWWKCFKCLYSAVKQLSAWMSTYHFGDIIIETFINIDLVLLAGLGEVHYII